MLFGPGSSTSQGKFKGKGEKGEKGEKGKGCSASPVCSAQEPTVGVSHFDLKPSFFPSSPSTIPGKGKEGKDKGKGKDKDKGKEKGARRRLEDEPEAKKPRREPGKAWHERVQRHKTAKKMT